MNYKKIYFFSIALLLVGCQTDEAQPTQPQTGTLAITTSVDDFEGRVLTRTTLDGNAFETGDLIKLKMICPETERTQLGESTYSGSYDGFYLLKWHTDSLKWLTLTAKDNFDINGDYSPSASPDIYSKFLAQPTPYVFTAQTWSEEQIFVAGNGIHVEQYSNVFHADQSKMANYKASDLMWAQTIMQTGSYNIHLSFKHVMAALMITLSPADGITISDAAVLTINGVPDIDQAEVIVGDYYAAKSKVNSNDYGYKAKHACTAEQNGKVIGVAVIDHNEKKASTMAMGNILQSATYTAYHEGNKIYRLIIPPCTLNNNATIWLRDGAKRYSMTLDMTTFEAGKLYNVTFNIKNDENQ